MRALPQTIGPIHFVGIGGHSEQHLAKQRARS